MTPWRILSAAAGLGVTILALVLFVLRPDHAFLVASGDARWIRAARPFNLAARNLATEKVRFRHVFRGRGTGIESGAAATLYVRALRAFRVSVNDRVVGAVRAEESPWRFTHGFDLAPYLEDGANELDIEVENDRGPPVLLAWSPALGIATGPTWRARSLSGSWGPTTAAIAGRRLWISNRFPSAWEGLRASGVLLLVAFSLGAGASLAYARWRASRPGAWQLQARHVQWLVMAALAVLGLHNLTRLEIGEGFDASNHFAYIRYVAAHWRIPLANEGWQMFQPPLFYLVAAPPYLAITRLASEQTAMLAMRVLVIACGLGLVVMAAWAARITFPRRDGLQMIAILTAGFLPMNVYMSQYVSNEPASAVLTAALVVAAFRLLSCTHADLKRWGFGLGLLFGFALLTKVSVALLLPLIVVALARVAHRQGTSLGAAVEPVLAFALAAGGISGWYFTRNWLSLGTPYLGGWDLRRGIAWIQDPGYRVPADLLSFGESLQHPIYAVFSGLWDGIYSTFWLDGLLGSRISADGAPPWHYDQVLACALLALPLAAAGLIGALRSLRVPRTATDEVLLFATAAVILYLGGIFVMFVELPIYSTVKSTYMLGLVPCFGVLFAWGFDLLPRHTAFRSVVAGYLTGWLACVFRAYFV